MPPKEPYEVTDDGLNADAKPTDPVTYPQPFVSRKLYEMSDDFKEEYRSGPTRAGEFPSPWNQGRRTDARKEPAGDE